jgi:predicted small lipoprotein YifL
MMFSIGLSACGQKSPLYLPDRPAPPANSSNTEFDAQPANNADAARKPGTLDELAKRRGRMNPRLPFEWLRYLVSVGAFESADGWRWKIDPSMRFGGFGPWRPEWTINRLPGLPMPFLGVLGREQEEMGWGTLPHHVMPYLPEGGWCEVLDDVGHFVHIERPEQVSAMVLEFLGGPQ